MASTSTPHASQSFRISSRGCKFGSLSGGSHAGSGGGADDLFLVLFAWGGALGLRVVFSGGVRVRGFSICTLSDATVKMSSFLWWGGGEDP